MIKLIALYIMAASFVFSAEEIPRLSKESQAIIDKALDANLAAPSKAYDVYQKSLADASAKTLKDLEKIKADANDTKKGSMSLKERTALIDAVEANIAEVKKGSLGERIVAKSGGDLLGEQQDSSLKDLVAGTWELHQDAKATDGALWVGKFNADGTAVVSGAGIGKWILVGNELTVAWGGNIHKWTMTDKQVIVGEADGKPASMKKVDYKKKR